MMSMASCRTCQRPTPLEELASEEMCTACCHKAFGLTGLDADWDKEAERLFARLNVEQDGLGGRSGKHSDLDVIWQDPSSGARVFVGNRRAAMNLKILDANKITSIVNCQGLDSVNAFENRQEIRYWRMDVQHWPLVIDENSPDGTLLIEYFAPCFSWIEDSIRQGSNVLIHCYAGAHRAGTVAVAFLMHTVRLRLSEALRVARHCRPIINPFARLLKLLSRYEQALEDAGLLQAQPASSARR